MIDGTGADGVDTTAETAAVRVTSMLGGGPRHPAGAKAQVKGNDDAVDADPRDVQVVS